MDSNDDKIKRLKSEDGQPLPPELEWEQMQEGILKKMEELQAPSPPGRRFPFNRNTAIAAGLILVLLFLSLLCSRRIIDTTQNRPAISQRQTNMGHSEWQGEPIGNAADTPAASTAEKAYSNQENNALDHKPGLSDDGMTGTASTRGQQSLQGVRSSSAYKKVPRTTLTLEPIATEKGPAAGTANSSPVKEAPPRLETNRQWEPAAPLQEPGPADGLLPVEPGRHDSHAPVQALSPKVFYPEQEAAASGLPAAFRAIPQKVTGQERRPRGSGRLMALGGVSSWNMGFGNTQPERYDYERTLTSHHAQLNYLLPFKKHFTVLIGFQFQQLESRFDWSATIEDYPITLTDTIIQAQTNALTGEQTVVRGDVELTVPAVRTVRHYNTTRLYQIPIAIGKTWTVKNWQADVFLGGAVNVLSANTGRTFLRGELRYYDGANTGFLASQWTFHAMLSGRLSYNINRRIGITTGIQFQRSLSNWSTEEGINMHPNVIIGEIGVSYGL